MLDLQPSPTEGRYAFAPHDEVKIGGRSYQPHSQNDGHYVFAPKEPGGLAVSYSHAELARLAGLGTVDHNRDALLPEQLRNRARLSSEMISCLSQKQQLRAKYREAAVFAFLRLEQMGKVKRTDAAINAALPEIKQPAGDYLSVPSEGDEHQLGDKVRITPRKVSAKSLRRWVRAYETLGLPGLEPLRVCRRLPLLSRMEPHEQDDEQVLP